MAKINFSQLAEKAKENSTFPTLDSGNYEFVAVEAEFQESKAGNPMIVVQLQEVETKIKIREFLTLTEKAYFKVRQFLNNAGIEEPTGDMDLDSDEFDDFVFSLVGATVYATVKTGPALDQKTKKSITTEDGEPVINSNIDKYISKDKVGKGKTRKKRTL